MVAVKFGSDTGWVFWICVGPWILTSGNLQNPRVLVFVGGKGCPQERKYPCFFPVPVAQDSGTQCDFAWSFFWLIFFLLFRHRKQELLV